MTARVVHLVLDTNVFMHFAWVDVDWCGLAGAEEVVLVVPMVVTRELDRNRKEHRLPGMKERIRKLLANLAERRKSRPIMIRPHVELRYRLQEPTNWADHEVLDSEIDDDRVIATALEVRASGVEVALVTDDQGPALKAEHYGLRVFVPPQEHKLPDVTDEGAQELKKAKAELAAMKNARPRVVCSFERGEREVVLDADDLDEASPDIAEMVRKEALRVPEQHFHGPTHREIVDIEIARLRGERKRMKGPTLSEVIELNERRDRYLVLFGEHIKELAEWAIVARRFHVFTIVVANEGQVAADDMDVLLSTRGIAFRERAYIPDRPTAPGAPGPDRYEAAFIAASLYEVDPRSGPHLPVPTSSVREDGTWHGHIPRLKQGLQHEFEVVIERPSREWDTPAEIAFKIVAANGFGDATGKLLIKFARGREQPASGGT